MTVQELKQTHQKTVALCPSEPGGAHVELKYRATCYPLGFSVELASNSEEVIAAAKEAWAGHKPLVKAWPIQLRIVLADTEQRGCPPQPKLRLEHNLFTNVADQNNYCICDIAQGLSFACLSRAAFKHPDYFRAFFLDSPVHCQISNRYATPIRAACVELDGRGVLLCGNAGAGKSTLAYALANTGWTYISDDYSFLVNERTDRMVLGNSLEMRLPPDATELFPELASCAITEDAAGKRSLELRPSATPLIKRAPVSRISYVVFLNRFGPKHEQLDVFQKEAAHRFITRPLHSLPEVRAVQETRLATLLQVKTLELRYHELSYGISRLTRLVREDR